MAGKASLMQGAWDLGQAFANARRGPSIGDQMKAAFDAARATKAQSEAELNALRMEERQAGLRNLLGGHAGLTYPQVDELVDFWNKGNWGEIPIIGAPMAPQDPMYFDLGQAFNAPAQVPMAAAENKPMPDFQPAPVQNAAAPNWYTPDVATKANQARSLVGLNRMATGDSNAEHLSDALGNLIAQAYQGAVASGDPRSQQFKEALAAGEGKPTYDVTASGIGFNRFGDASQMDTSAFDRAGTVKAKATVDAALARARTIGNKLPAEAALVEYYKSQGYPAPQAIQLAKNKKGTPLSELAVEAYTDAYNNASFINPDLPPEKVAEEAANRIVEYARRFEAQPQMIQPQGAMPGAPGGAADLGAAFSPAPSAPRGQPPMQQPMPGAQLGKDGHWYLQQNGQWYLVQP